MLMIDATRRAMVHHAPLLMVRQQAMDGICKPTHLAKRRNRRGRTSRLGKIARDPRRDTAVDTSPVEYPPPAPHNTCSFLMGSAPTDVSPDPLVPEWPWLKPSETTSIEMMRSLATVLG